MVFGRIYSIRSHQTTELYIGSTTQALSMRLSGHRRHYKKYLNTTFHYVTSFKILQYNDAYIELLFEREFESKDALQQKEGEYIRDMECVNKQIAGRTKKEYYEDNKDVLAENKKEYIKQNKALVSERKHTYYESNKKELNERSKIW